ncbi:DUF72 domain-containing protein [Variovorax sp. N23]|uniref:DUF72 domain-containing protein n=1 Tax=Variovorax sp. N23 TaxID=2980555 RepID=UPI0021CAD600|nr:DUF72 domain-containing protein [Variovorax sp. N23]MCU4119923.1 DUF72 domain-containing protein [Variovorax sp. N23]
MQDSLFPDLPDEADAPSPATASAATPAPRAARGGAIAAQPVAPALQAMADALPRHVRLGTSTWSYPGWAGIVWDGTYAESRLAKDGLTAYARHPLLRTVCVDRAFYRPLSAIQYARLAALVPPDFRFVVKAPSLVTDALVRGEEGRGRQPNPAFLNPELAVHEFVRPALDGLGAKVGALVFQLSPLPLPLLARRAELFERLAAMLRALPALRPDAPDGVIAVEVRDPELLTPALADLLRDAGATYCLGLHPKLPPIAEQLPMLRALWPGPLVCRWNVNRRHGAYGYEDAEALYAPFDKMVHPDIDTRTALARVIAGTAGAGQNVYVTISNKAEGSAPLSVQALAEQLHRPSGRPAFCAEAGPDA